MLYLSQLLGRKIYYHDQVYGKILDMAVFMNHTVPPVSKIEVKHNGTKITIAPQALRFVDGKIILTADNMPHLPYDHKDLYLGEDLLDKQVIDTDGKRLVRVNDVVLDNETELQVKGIDVGFDGILRRLGLGMIPTRPKTLPWNFIEAFDYDTGTIKLKLKENTLSKLHPADIADILEDAGTKERLGIVASLDAKQAARAIEEADEETQLSILENLTPTVLKEVINKMHVAELADVFHDLNPLKAQEIQNVLDADKLQTVQKLSSFSDTSAGGLMHEHFLTMSGTTTVGDVFLRLQERTFIPEIIVVTDEKDSFLGSVQMRSLLKVEKTATLASCITDTTSIAVQTPLYQLLKLFAQYNLRVLPVVDKEKKPIGVVLVDDVLKIMYEQEERNEAY